MAKLTIKGRILVAVLATGLMSMGQAVRAEDLDAKSFCQAVADDFRMKMKDGAWVDRWASLITVTDWGVALPDGSGLDTSAYHSTQKIFSGKRIEAMVDDQSVGSAECLLDPERSGGAYGVHNCSLNGAVELVVGNLFQGGRPPKLSRYSYRLRSGEKVTLHMSYQVLQRYADPVYRPVLCRAE